MRCLIPHKTNVSLPPYQKFFIPILHVFSDTVEFCQALFVELTGFQNNFSKVFFVGKFPWIVGEKHMLALPFPPGY